MNGSFPICWHLAPLGACDQCTIEELRDALESVRGERDAARAHTDAAIEAEQRTRAKFRAYKEAVERIAADTEGDVDAWELCKSLVSS
jgi:hypothetical protein